MRNYVALIVLFIIVLAPFFAMGVTQETEDTQEPPGKIQVETKEDLPTRGNQTYWPNKYGDARQTGRANTNVSGHIIDIFFRNDDDLFDDGNFPVVCPNGRVWLTDDCSLYSFSHNGSDMQRTEIRTNGYYYYLYDPICDDYGNVYFLSNWGQMYKYYPDGSQAWNISNEQFFSSTLTIKDDLLYVFSRNYTNFGYLSSYFLNGTIKWRIPFGDSTIGNLIVDDDGTLFYVKDKYENATLYSMYPNGTIGLERKIIEYSDVDLIMDDGTIIIRSWNYPDYSVKAFDKFGELLWNYFTDYPVDGKVALDYDNNLILVENDNLHKVLKNGTMSWKTSLSMAKLIQPFVTRDCIIIQESNHISFFDYDGLKISSITKLEYDFTGFALGPNNVIYFTDHSLAAIKFNPNEPPSIDRYIYDMEFEEDNADTIYFRYWFHDNQNPYPLNYSIEFENDNVSWEFLPPYEFKLTPKENWYGTFLARISARDRGYDNIELNEDDLITYTNWFNITFEPVDDPGQIVIEGGVVPVIYEGDFISLNLSYVDVDADGDHVTWSIKSGHDWLKFRRNNLFGTSPLVSAGDQNIEIQMEFRDGRIAIMDFELTILDKDHPPVLITPDYILLEEDTSKKISVGSSSTNVIIGYDPDGVENIHSIELGPHLSWGTGYQSSYIIGEKDWVGETEITVTLDDGTFVRSAVVPVIVENKLDEPKGVSIDLKQEGDIFEKTTPLYFEAVIDDPDDLPYSFYGYTWESNISGDLGSEHFLNTTLPSGQHAIKLTVSKLREKAYSWSSDSYYYLTTTIIVNISGIPEPKYNPDSGKFDDDDFNVDAYYDKADKTLAGKLIFACLVVTAFMIALPSFLYMIHRSILHSKRKKVFEEIYKLEKAAAREKEGWEVKE